MSEEKKVEMATDLAEFIIDNKIDIDNLDKNEIINYIKENSTLN